MAYQVISLPGRAIFIGRVAAWLVKPSDGQAYGLGLIWRGQMEAFVPNGGRLLVLEPDPQKSYPEKVDPAYLLAEGAEVFLISPEPSDS